MGWGGFLTAGILRKLLGYTQIPRGSSQAATWGTDKRLWPFVVSGGRVRESQQSVRVLLSHLEVD